MTRGRRAALLIGLALIMGALAAADIGGREARLRQSLQPLVDVVVARSDIRAGTALSAAMLTTRRVPGRYAPTVAVAERGALEGAIAAVDIPAGSDVSRAHVRARQAAPDLRAGERIVDVVATGSPRLILAGSRVDVLVTRESSGTRLALENAEVMSARPVAAQDGGSARVAAGLRVTVKQAVYLTSAQSFAREIRLLPRAGEDVAIRPEAASPRENHG